MCNILEAIPTETRPGSYFIANYPPFSSWSAEELPHLIHALATRPKRKSLGLYVHLPFCRHRCHYCYFRVYPRRSGNEVRQYTDTLLKEFQMYERHPALENRQLTSIYFGGGSPSFLSCEEIEHLFKGLQEHTSWKEVEECTFECEPGTVTPEKLRLLRDLGVTRISLGFQTLDDDVLRGSGRDVRRNDCMEAFANARAAGFEEINIDLLAGLPKETEATWRRTINSVLELLPECVTIYQLEVARNSKAMKTGGAVGLPDWRTKQKMMETGFLMCEQAGYTIGSGYMAVRDPSKSQFIYTIENFWHGSDLLALGEGSFGHLQGVHYQNFDRFGPYQDSVNGGRFPVKRVHKLTEEETLRREVILQLKTGVLDLGYYRQKFGIELVDHLEEEFETLIDKGFAFVNGNEVKLTRDALLRVDWIAPIFYLPEHQGLR